MLELQGIRNKINNIEKELEDMEGLTVADKFFILRARTALTQAEVSINILEENLQELREERKGV